jgi:translocation and assembly module TamB
MRFGRIALRITAGVAILLAAASIAAIMVFRSGWFHERVRERIVYELHKATGARVDFGSFAFDWTHLSATAGPIVLHGREAATEAPLVSIKSVVLGLRVISMLERKVDLSSLRIVQPTVHLIFYPDGSTNIPPHRETDWAQDLFDIAVRRYEVDDGLIEYDEHKIPLNLRGEDLRGEMSMDLRSTQYTGTIASRRIRAMIAGFSPVEMVASLSFALNRSRIEVKQLRLSTRQSKAELAGSLNDPRDPHGTLAFKSTIAVRDAVELFQLPVNRSGTALFDGQLSVSTTDFGIAGRLNGRGMGYTQDRLKIENADLRAEVRITPAKLSASAITLKALDGTFNGSAELIDWRRFHVEGNVAGLTVRDIGAIATDRKIPWNGTLAGSLRLDGTIQQPNTKFETALSITPGPEGSPISGDVDLSYDQAAGKLQINNTRLATSATLVEASGALGETLVVRAQTTRLEDVATALAFAGTELPSKITFARAVFTGTVTGPLDKPEVNGDALLLNASIDGHAFDRFTGKIWASSEALKVDNGVIARGVTVVEGSFEMIPPAREGSIAGQLQIRNANLADLEKEAGLEPALSGVAAGNVKFSGKIDHPEADVSVQIDKPAAFGEQLDRARASFHYSNASITVSFGEVELGAAKAQLKGSFQHRESDWKNGTLTFDVAAQNTALSAVKAYAALETGIDSTLEGKAAGSARLVNGDFVLTSMDADAKARNIVWHGQKLADATVVANTRANELTVQAGAQVRDIKVDAQGSWKLEGDDPGSATIHFSRTSMASLHRVVMTGGSLEQYDLPFEGSINGATASVKVALRKPRDFQAELVVPTVQINPRSTQTLKLGVQADDLVVKNSSPVIVDITSKEARIRSARFTARDTTLEATGAVPLSNGTADLTVRGSVNLIILQLLNPDMVARGNASVQAGIRGTLRDPQLSGRMDLKNASLYFSDLPNGVDNANGTVLFDRNRATIDKLRAETGGGTVDFAGFVGFGSPLVYRLQAVAQRVRVRYPEDVSVTFNATLALNGTSDASTLSGMITLTRASFTPRADLAQILAQASKPGPAPTTSSEYIRGTQFDVRIESGPNFEMETSLTRNLEAEVDLRLRGTPLRPALLGTASVNAGDVQVFGNRYTVDRCDIRFLNPVRIDPILDMNLETKARGVTVNIAVSGTMQKLNVNYSSDPPMQPREILALLAVGRAPADTAGLSPDQSPVNSNSLAEAGGGLIGQAISAQLSSRLQRFFGASRVKIDPTLTGVDYLPQARLTIEQQVSKDITLTYITNLNRTQEQIVQVEWDFSKQWSAVAVREANGLFGIDFQYKKRFK